jgi:hypothetical protein
VTPLLLLLLLLLPYISARCAATRSLLQVTMDCNAANRISKVNNACSLLCSCASALQKNKEGKANDADVKRCNNLCPKCSEAGKTCKPGSPLPEPCKEGTTNGYVQQCINTYLKSQSG